MDPATNEIVAASPSTPRIHLPNLQLLEEGRVVIVGLGGIGGQLARSILRFLAAWTLLSCRVVLVDGDRFEERNRARMEVPEIGNKANVLCRVLSRELGRARLSIRPVDSYVNPDNVERILQERDIVLGAVDNHATRRLLVHRCEQLENVVLISGGNDGIENGLQGSYGNVQIYQRQEGRDLSPPPTRYHPEIEHPEDEVPGPSCVDLAATVAPQLGFTNEFAAAVMSGAFLRLLASEDRGAMYHEACFDTLEARLVPHWLDGDATTTPA